MANVAAFNTTTPANPTINPLDAQLAQDSAADALWSKVRGSFNTLQGTFDRLSQVSDTLFSQIAQIEADTSRTPGWKAEQTVNARNAALEQVENLRRAAEAARTQVVSVVAPVMDPSGFIGGTNDTATLIFIERVRDAWSRVKMVLDSLQDAGQVMSRASVLAKTAAERGDSFTQSAIRQNLEAYLEARGVHTPHDVLVSQLNTAMVAASTPQFRAALVIQQTLDAGWTNLQGAFFVALGYCKGNSTMRIQGLPGWPGFPTISL